VLVPREPKGGRGFTRRRSPSWCPAWPVAWQRFHLTRGHLDASGTLPTVAGSVVRQGEDLGQWVASVRLECEQLGGVRQWMCGQVLGIEPAGEDEKPKPRISQGEKWAMHLTAARRYFEREGHLRVPRKHVENLRFPRDARRGDSRSDGSRGLQLPTTCSARTERKPRSPTASGTHLVL
jgi:hypothetical protein